MWKLKKYVISCIKLFIITCECRHLYKIDNRDYVNNYFYKPKPYQTRPLPIHGRIAGFPTSQHSSFAHPDRMGLSFNNPFVPHKKGTLFHNVERPLFYPYPKHKLRLNSVKNDVLPQKIWGDTTEWDYPFDPYICESLKGLNRLQFQLCKKHPEAVSAAAVGLKLAVKECQIQLKNHPWNCTTLSNHHDNPHLSPIMEKGYSETAFVHAITSAGVTHSVSRACASGKLPLCSCGSVSGKRAWKWSGCHDNTKYGAKFSRMFLDVRERIKDVVSYMHMYNNEVGRKVVRRNRKVHCKCHGMSGSCEIRTCWKSAPKFSSVGQIILKKFKDVKSASHTVFGNAIYRLRSFKPIRRSMSINSPLLYSEKSPNICHEDNNFGISGTVGRVCNQTSTGSDSCSSMCCGRGFNVVKKRVVKRCNCRFKWCCHVTCSDCVSERWVSVCK